MNRTPKHWLSLLLALTCLNAYAETPASPQPEAPPDFKQGKAVYKASCALCHDQGRNGAPRLGHAADWKNRYFEWQPLMQKHASSGYLNMPAKGYNPQLGEQDVSNAVFYMAEKLKGKQ